MSSGVFDSEKGKTLVSALLSLKTSKEVERFLRDLLTEAETREFANRFAAAQMLESGVSYTKIAENTGMSSTTIARISKWLNGALGGYKLAISRLHHTHTEPVQAGKI